MQTKWASEQGQRPLDQFSSTPGSRKQEPRVAHTEDGSIPGGGELGAPDVRLATGSELACHQA